MRARPDRFQEFDDVVDIFVEAEPAGGERHVAGIVPVGDVDVVLGQHGLHRRPQQRGEMARQRRHQQHARLLGGDVFLEMQQRAERRGQRRLLAHLDIAIADGDRVDAEGRARMRQARARDQLIDGGEIAQRRVIARAAAGRRTSCRHAGPGADRHHDVGLQLISEIQHPEVRSRYPRARRLPTGPARSPNSGRLVHFLLHCDKKLNILHT